MRTHTLLVAVMSFGLLAAGAHGQVLYTLESANPESLGFFGVSVSGAGDVDNDGYEDVVVAGHLEDGGAADAGRVYVFSGQTGGVLYTLESSSPEVSGDFGCSVSGAGDVNNDGYDDVIVGAYAEDGGAANAGRVYVFSGRTGGLLYPLESPSPEALGAFGISVSGAGDVDGDGYDDAAVGAFFEDGGATDAGRVYVFSGQTGGLLYPLESPSPEALGAFGISVSGAGDVNGDGYDDAVVGAFMEDGGATDAGRAYVFSGQTGGLLYTLESPNPEGSGLLGYSVSGAGYVNADSYADVIVGAMSEDGGALAAGRAYVFDGIEVPVELVSFTSASTAAALF
jgi:hypothetical protein